MSSEASLASTSRSLTLLGWSSIQAHPRYYHSRNEGDDARQIHGAGAERDAVVVGVEPEPGRAHGQVVAEQEDDRQEGDAGEDRSPHGGAEPRCGAAGELRERVSGGPDEQEDREPERHNEAAVDERRRFGDTAGRDHAELQLGGQPRGQEDRKSV